MKFYVLCLGSGEYWKQTRAFAFTALRNFGFGRKSMESRIREEIASYLNVIEQQNGEPYDMREMTVMAVSNTICSITFGNRFEYNDSKVRRVTSLFAEEFRLLATGSPAQAFPFLKYLPGDLFNLKKLIQNTDKIKSFVLERIIEHRSTFDEGNHRDFIDAFLSLQKQHGQEGTIFDGAFLIPYLLSLILGAAPVMITELGLGQYMSQGVIGVWKICPLFQGVGVATMVILTYYNIYYMLILAWGGYYMVMSMQSVLPWTHCNNTWNTDRCSVSREMTIVTCLNKLNASQDTYNASRQDCLNATSTGFLPVDPTVEFWERGVIQKSSGIEESGGVVWEIALSLFIVWVIIYFCVWRGVELSGKVVYFTAVFPYVVLACLLVRGLTLDGALDGITYFIIPDFNRLSDVQVWIDGGTQIFFSLAVAFGGLMTLGSYKKFNDNFYRDSIVIMCINSGTSILGGFAVFSVLGFMAHEQGVDISDISTSGTALAFLTYPKAVSKMPGASFWAVLFFFMLFLVGMDSLFLGVEVVGTMMIDALPERYQRSWNRMVLTAVYCFALFLVGLSMTTRGGIYIWILFDNFSASGMVLLWVCFWECIALGWVFGAEKFEDVLNMMLGFKINVLFRICLKFITPILTTGLFISQLVALRLDSLVSSYSYPPLAKAFGLLLSISSMICVPAVMVYKITNTPGTVAERLKILTTPIIEENRIPHSWDLKKVNVTKCPQDEEEEML